MAASNQDKLAHAYAGFLAGDLSKILALLRDDVTWQATGRSPVAGVDAGKAEVQRFFSKMSDLYGGTLRLQVRAVFSDARTGMVLTREHGSYQGEDLAYTSVHVFSFDDAGLCSEFLALQDDAYDEFWAQHARPA